MMARISKTRPGRLLLALIGVLAMAAGTVNGQALAKEGFDYYSGTDTQAVDHSAWAAFLNKYAIPSTDISKTGPINLIDYGKAVSDSAALQSYIDSLAAMNPTMLTEDEAFAYWINLYNAVTVKVVLDNYPVNSIRDIRTGIRPGPWKQELVTVNGAALTLDNIERDILMEHWREPRVHYAINCGSMSCPSLALQPYTGSDIDQQLDRAAMAYINSPRGVRFDKDGDLVVSSIFKWYRSDFGNSETQVLNHIRRYADDELRARLAGVNSVSDYEYDWSLNEIP